MTGEITDLMMLGFDKVLKIRHTFQESAAKSYLCPEICLKLNKREAAGISVVP